MLLNGVKVLDISRFLPGPYASMIMADMGAEVIKVEQPGNGDPGRTLMPDMFATTNRNKKSMIINLKTTEGQEIIYRLISSCDVFIESFRPGIVAKLKIDYEHLSKINPGIIYCSISGFGQDGPYRDRPGHDINYMGFGGALSIPGDLEFPAIRSGLPVSDISSAMYALIGILTALVGKKKDGRGQYLDISMADTVVAWTSTRMGAYLLNGEEMIPEKMVHLSPYNRIFETKNGKITMGIVEDAFWQNFCRAIGRTDWLADPRLDTHQKRLQNWRLILPDLKEEFAKRTREEWMNILIKADVPCGPVYLPHEVFEDPQFKIRQMLAEVDDGRGNTIKQVTLPIKFSGMTMPVRTPPPELGAHTEEILLTAGYTSAEIAVLKEKTVI